MSLVEIYCLRLTGGRNWPFARDSEISIHEFLHLLEVPRDHTPLCASYS